MTKLSRYRSEITVRLLEMQAHRCATCGREINITDHLDSSARACTIKVDRDAPRSYKNCVLVCRLCAGRQSAYPSLMSFFEGRAERYSPDQSKKEIKLEVIHEIQKHLAALGWSTRIPKDFGRAPIERAEDIAETLARRYAREGLPQDRSAKKKEKRSLRKPKWLNRGTRRQLLEIQNYRCCYDGFRFDDFENALSPRYPTIEHVEGIAEGGYSTKNNVVIACRVCNTMRANMGMTAYEFYEWAKDNVDKIERQAKRDRKSLEVKIMTKGEDWFASIRHPPKPLFSTHG